MPEIKDNEAGQERSAQNKAEGSAAEGTQPTPAASTPQVEPAPKMSRTAKPARAAEAARTAKPARTAKAARAAEPAQRPRGARRAQAKVRRRWPAIVAGTATLALAVTAVGAGTLFPGENATAQTEIVPHVLPVGESLANCAGPTQLLAGSAAGSDPEFSPNSSGTTTRLNAVGLSSAAGELTDASVQALDGQGSHLFDLSKASDAAANNPETVTGKPKMRASILRSQTVEGPSALHISPLGEEMPLGAASVVVDAPDGDLKGLAAATCQTPSNELWLAGASTSIGRSAVLKIANSSASPATVSLTLHTGQGLIQAAGGNGIAVAPGTVRSVVLAGLVPDQELISVNLKSTGGAVSAVIQQSVLRGLTPGGVDYLAPIQAPATSLTIPGVRVQAPDVAAKISQQNGYGDATTAMAITVPGARDSVVEVKAYGPDGQVALPDGGVFTAAAGKVSLMPLKGLPEGAYSLSVTADEAVSATVRLVNSTKPGDAVDMAYASSASRLGGAHLLSVPQDVTSSLVFTAPEAAATLRLVPIMDNGELGTAKDLELKAGRTLSVDPLATLGDKTVAVLVSVAGAPVFGSQLLGSKDSANLAVLPIPGTSAGSHSISIVTGY